ncbi:hypothetical protein pb186bvf_009074 [Paramecium bursaria]
MEYKDDFYFYYNLLQIKRIQKFNFCLIQNYISFLNTYFIKQLKK